MNRELGMTQRYMHLSPAALDAAIQLLDQSHGPAEAGHYMREGRGNIVATADAESLEIRKC